MSDIVTYGLLIAMALFMIRRTLMFRTIQKKVDEYKKEGAIIVDVRSAGEYGMGHVEGSINIPLQELGERAGELDPQKTVLLCCASGTRSGMAASVLKSKGFQNVHNAGPWNGLV
jgi:rhodanese-related sulfurtransferase